MAVDLSRFYEAQEGDYANALQEVRQGRKQGHWMWYIFPQIAGLGHSSTSQYYAIRNILEAYAYLQDPVLGPRLINISRALLGLSTRDAQQVFGSPDDLKLRSCMTLFCQVEGSDPVFRDVLDRFFGGQPDPETLRLLK